LKLHSFRLFSARPAALPVQVNTPRCCTWALTKSKEILGSGIAAVKVGGNPH
jgi:hypothetical protein